MDSTIYILMIGCFIAGLLIGYWIHFFVYEKNSIGGELIFTQINEDEAKLELESYSDSWLDVMNEDKVIFKVIRR